MTGEFVGLQKYQAKRRFNSTPEPQGEPQAYSGPLRFVVQKHRASRLHFDFRLEAGEVLKSWAVPKGPPALGEKRLAMMVEDHPLDYFHFEGVIPAGNYGAGTVMVWDTGTYHVPGITDRRACEQAVLDGLKAGQFHVILHGRKLNGEFILVHPKRGEENAWLWFAKEAGGPIDVGDADRSVLSGRTLDEITVQAPARPIPQTDFDLTGATKASVPRGLRPMLASPADAPFDDPNWIFEIKWDGYRAIAEIEEHRVHLYSRTRLSYDKQFAAIVESLQYLGRQAILDGEIVVLDRQGKPQFQLLQGYAKSGQGTLVYKVFDVLYLDGYDLRKLPLRRRKELLVSLVRNLPGVLVSEHIQEHGKAFFEAVAARQLEGMVAKDARSTYQVGVRSKSWLKLKTQLRQQVVIGGFTEQKGTRLGLGALLLGIYEDERLVCVGHVGTGFKEKDLLGLRNRFENLIQKTCPFARRPKCNGVVHWLQPKLVCQVTFSDWTSDGQLRHPVFQGIQEDKDPLTINRQPSKVEEPVVAPVQVSPAPSALKAAPPKAGGERLLIGGHTVQVTNLKKIYWPEEGYTKGDLIEYYRTVASFIVPYLLDRPQSLHRHPNGIAGKSFFQHDVRKQPPPVWVQTAELPERGNNILSVLCQDEATLVYLANLGCIELNPLNSRIGALEHPDYVLLDLDPEDVPFARVVETAQAARKILESLDVPVYCKTSGKRGLHLYIPFGARYSHDQAKDFALLIARLVHAQLPGDTSLVRDPSMRQGRVYLDFVQNGQGKTLAAAYCVRPVKGATVSAPLKWTEVKPGLNPARFTIHTMKRRLDAVGDIWHGVLGPGINLHECLERLANRMKQELS